MKFLQLRSTRINKIYQRQQLRTPRFDEIFLSLILLIYTVLDLGSGSLSDFLSTSLQMEFKIIDLAIRLTFTLALNILAYLYYRSKRLKQIKQAHTLETIIVLLIGCDDLVHVLLRITQTTEVQLDFVIFDAKSLLWFMLIISFIKKTVNVILYIALELVCYLVLLFNLKLWIGGAKTLIQGLLLIILIIYQERKKMESFLENWKLKTDGVLYKSVLSSLPESIMIITERGKVEYQNSYMKKMLEYDIQDGVENFYNYFSALNFRECIEETKFKLISSHNYLLDRTFLTIKNVKHISVATEGVFKMKAAEVGTFQGLIQFFNDNIDIWKKMSNHTLIFDTKYKVPQTDKVLSIEIKAFVLVENEEAQLSLVLKDTTDRDRIAALESEKEVYKNNVIGSLSHELRTPLNANLGFIEQCMDHPELPFELKENFLEPALMSSKLLLHIINDVLDYSQLLNRTFNLNIQPNYLSSTIKKTIGLFEKRIYAKGLKLEVVISPEEHMFYTDHERLTQILVNLLGNALKFTFEGTITVHVDKETDSSYKISVSDTGIGMDESTKEKIRKTVVTGKISESRLSSNSAGIGLGLLMTGVFCRCMSSEQESGLKFNSTLGEGSEFYFSIRSYPPHTSSLLKVQEKKSLTMRTLMAEVADATLTNDNEENILSSAILGYRTQHFKNKLLEAAKSLQPSQFEICEKYPVLIVDDEIFNILILESYCRALGLKTERAFNGKEAVEKIKTFYKNGSKVGLVLMDINMPIMDGYEATQIVKEMVSNQEIGKLTIIGVTAYISKDKIDKCYEVGMDDVANKPLSQSNFLKLMSKHGFIKPWV